MTGINKRGPQLDGKLIAMRRNAHPHQRQAIANQKKKKEQRPREKVPSEAKGKLASHL
jgi:hypothetical protein